jgi:endonuclease/exonuclease/phosphatase family metal-dependent hydrolase
MLVDTSLAFYKVPYNLNWLTHIKVSGYAGWPGQVHIIGVYLKLGGNYRRLRGKALITIKKIVKQIQLRKNDAKVIILEDFNKEATKIINHLAKGEGQNPLIVAHMVSLKLTRFPTKRGQRRELDHILLTNSVESKLQSARVHHEYISSNHQLIIIRPKVMLPVTVPEKN